MQEPKKQQIQRIGEKSEKFIVWGFPCFVHTPTGVLGKRQIVFGVLRWPFSSFAALHALAFPVHVIATVQAIEDTGNHKHQVAQSGEVLARRTDNGFFVA